MRDVLKQLGLDNKEVSAYLAGLELGPAPIAEIAKKAGLPRSSCYLVIEDLIKKGLFTTSYLGKKKLFIAEPPQRLLRLAKSQLEQAKIAFNNLEGNLPLLTSLYNLMPQKPKVRFYEGFEGIKTIFEETLSASEILVLCSGYTKPIEKKLNQYLEDYFKKVLNAQIPTFELIGEAPDAKDYQRKYSDNLHQIRLVPHPEGTVHIDKMLFSNMMALVSFEYLNGVIIENKPIVDFEKALFWKLWRSPSETTL